MATPSPSKRTTSDVDPPSPPNVDHTPVEATHAPPTKIERGTATTVQPTTASTVRLTPSTASHPSRPGRRSKFSPSDDIVLVREVAAAKAHVAPNGETKDRFEIAAARANASGKLASVFTWKSIQDRYKRMLSQV